MKAKIVCLLLSAAFLYSPSVTLATPGVATFSGLPSFKIQEGNRPHYISMWVTSPENVDGSIEFFFKKGNKLDYALAGNTKTRTWSFGNPNRLQNGWNLAVAGTITLNGRALTADYVFEPDFQLESISEHARYMWENKHLPAIPSASDIETNGLDLGQTQRGIIEELEKAHIYIEQLHERLQRLEDIESRLLLLESQD